jgi:hypothetical protein
MTHPDQERAFATVLATMRESGFASFDLGYLSIAALLGFFKRSGYLVTQTVLTVNHQTRQTTKITLSGIYGHNPFPYHTDYSFVALPTKFVILANDSANSFKRTTLVASFASIPHDMIALLRNAHWLLNSKSGAFLISSAQRIGAEALFRWDSDFLVPYNQAARQSMTCIPYYFEQARKEIAWAQRSAILINNWSCAHARGGMVSMDDDVVRSLIRYEVWRHA